MAAQIGSVSTLGVGGYWFESNPSDLVVLKMSV